MDLRIPTLPFAPKVYHCQRAREPLTLDGNLDKPFWQPAPWTEDFADIEGDMKPQPRYRTRTKMLWDDGALYIGAEVWGDEIWAHVKERDDIIFSDNDFEIFIDPDSDSHCYCEYEMNALGTMWDLLLTKPYRDQGIPIDSFDIKGLRSAVSIEGELNNPKAHNVKWSLEVVMPFRSLMECTGQHAFFPRPGDFWRINFSRVQWRVHKEGAAYEKVINPETGRPYPEDNWVWSPIGVVNMHYPELWGFLFFCANEGDRFEIPEDEKRKWLLRQYYYAQQERRRTRGTYGEDISLPGPDFAATVTDSWFEARCPDQRGQGLLTITADGKTTPARRVKR